MSGTSSTGAAARAPQDEDAEMVATLDTEYQLAVKHYDVQTMDRILLDDFVLVLGNGITKTKSVLLAEARDRMPSYEIQDEEAGSQQVRVWGDTAVVTAKLRLKGHNAAGPFDRTVWFSDTYVRTPAGWRYAFGQASLPLPGAVGASVPPIQSIKPT